MLALIIAVLLVLGLDGATPSAATGTIERVSVSSAEAQANHMSGRLGAPVLDGDVGIVAFDSFATNLVTGDTNGDDDIFGRERVAGTTDRVSVSSSEAQANNESGGPSISDDGNIVASSQRLPIWSRATPIRSTTSS